MKTILVIGAGPAGMMAAIKAAENGADVTILEKMKRPGKKMLITGKGRCNITNAATVPEIIKNIHGNGKFLNSSMRAYDNEDVIYFFESQGVPTKVERGQRVFPVSDKAQDVVDAMVHKLHELGVKIVTESPVAEILAQDDKIKAVKLQSGASLKADAVILCTGGASYPGTGSTGDGYKIAQKLGHTLVDIRPSLVPLETEEDWVKSVQGLSLRNVTLSLYEGDRRLFQELGEMLFTHFGVSGPLMLSASTYMRPDGKDYRLLIDLKPALTPEKLDERLLRDFAENANRDFINALDALLPKKLIPLIVERSGIPERTKVNAITRAQRLRLRDLIKAFPIELTRPRPIAEAIVTAGGVVVSEVQPRTMESRLLPGLYFAGEILDLDARTGGFNLQIAWSTGYVAGNSVPIKENQ